MAAGCRHGRNSFAISGTRARNVRAFRGDGADAVRFSMAKDQEGIIGIYWVVEKDHHAVRARPARILACEQPASCAAHTDARVARQAQAYISSYLRRKEDLGRR
jgi:hypothetical protein